MSLRVVGGRGVTCVLRCICGGHRVTLHNQVSSCMLTWTLVIEARGAVAEQVPLPSGPTAGLDQS